MNDDQHQRVSDEQIDRLVDGEVRGDEFQEVLLRLESEPGAWRRCALAFLEAQALSSDLREPDRRRGNIRPVAIPASNPGPVWLAIVASFLVAFSLGIAWRWDLPRTPPAAQAPAVVAEPPVAESSLPALSAEIDREGDRGGQQWHYATVVIQNPDGGSQEVPVPVFRPGNMDRARLEQMVALPRNVHEDLRELGYRLRRETTWQPLESNRGQRVFFPMSEFEITPISMRYQ